MELSKSRWLLDAPRPEELESTDTELMDPRRLVDVDDGPPNPEKPSFAGRDSSGNRSPVLVTLDNHIRWYRAELGRGGLAGAAA